MARSLSLCVSSPGTAIVHSPVLTFLTFLIPAVIDNEQLG